MHRVSPQRRALAFRRFIAGLDARDPSLVNFSLPVNSIIGPLASPLVGDEDAANDETAQPSTSLDTQPPLSSASGDGSGSSNGGGSVPTPTPSPTSDEIPPDPPGPPGIPGTLDPPIPPGSITPSPSSSPSPPSSPGEQSSLYSADDAGGGGVINSSGTSGDGSAAIIQVSSGSFTTTFSSFSATYPAAVATGFPSPSQSSQDSGSNIGTASSSPATTIAASAKQLSGGVIASITIVCFFSLLALIILVIRRRSIAGRMELRKNWWFARNPSGGSFSSAGSANSRSRVGSHEMDQASRSSYRSSFATNFDQGFMIHVVSPSRISPDGVPDLPPMAEVRDRSAILNSTRSAVARRESSNTMLSKGSVPDAHAQYLSIPADQNNVGPSIHISVRPFSPSESFTFPKPPRPPARTVDSFFIPETRESYSSGCSTSTLVHLSMPPRALGTNLPPTSPFAPSLHPETLTPAQTLSHPIVSSNPPTDPFSDPVAPEFADIEVIHRDFAPSLDDELAVRPGEHVRLLRMYDDGWVLAEKLAGFKDGRHEQGLIPINCLHDAGQTPPTSKRVSSYSEYEPDEFIGTAL